MSVKLPSLSTPRSRHTARTDNSTDSRDRKPDCSPRQDRLFLPKDQLHHKPDYQSPLTESPRYNKLSFRHIAKPTPPPGRIREREASFVNDAVKSSLAKRKYPPWDMIPMYNSVFDPACDRYTARPDVRRLMAVTCPEIYRTPPTPEPFETYEKEKSFVLDCNAASSISRDYSMANPKLGPVIPPYNAQQDKKTKNYFEFEGVPTLLKKTAQKSEELPLGTSIEGKVHDKFFESGHGAIYLGLRNKSGAGHSRELIEGHAQFMENIKPVSGWNGRFGFRRTTPWLRAQPSPFGTASRSPCH